MTATQMDLMALYCLIKGIKAPSNIRRHIEEYEQIRQMVSLCNEEMANVLEEKEDTREG